MAENKPFFIDIDGEAVEVTGEVYRAYMQGAWAERKRRAAAAGRELSLEKFMDGGTEFASAEPPPDSAISDMVSEALAELHADECGLIVMLFFENKSERETAAETGLSQQIISWRKKKVLKKIKKIFKKMFTSTDFLR
jgi:DNA-directed RNA polymerase specialized sigma24 family protein